MKHIVGHLLTLLQEGVATVTSRKDYTPIENFLKEDWDNMIILDGCRYEMLDDQNPFEAETEAIFSNASHTLEFLRKNLKGRDNSDIVYVTASPQVARMDLGLHARYDVWEKHWNDEHGTVLPGDVTAAAEEAIKAHPDKRIIIHYMQPHYPFIGEKADDIASPMYDSILAKKTKTVWEQLAAGELTEDEVREAYHENLAIVLDEVQELIPLMSGKTVITSDHGNVYGKKIGMAKVYGHGYGWSDREIARVGWIEIKNGQRRKIKKGSGTDHDRDEDKIKDRLNQLGYGV